MKAGGSGFLPRWGSRPLISLPRWGKAGVGVALRSAPHKTAPRPAAALTPALSQREREQYAEADANQCKASLSRLRERAGVRVLFA